MWEHQIWGSDKFWGTSNFEGRFILGSSTFSGVANFGERQFFSERNWKRSKHRGLRQLQKQFTFFSCSELVMTHNDHDNCYQIRITRAPNDVEFFYLHTLRVITQKLLKMELHPSCCKVLNLLLPRLHTRNGIQTE